MLLTAREQVIACVCSDTFWSCMARPENERVPLTRETSNALLISVLVNRQVAWRQAMNLVPEMKRRTLYKDTLLMFTELTPPMIEFVMFEKPALHRHHYQARFCHEAMVRVRDVYDGDTRNLWRDEPTGGQLLGRLMDFNGYGWKTSALFLRLAVFQNGVQLHDGFMSCVPSDDRHVRRVGARLGLWGEDVTVKNIHAVARRLNMVCPVTLDALFVIGTDFACGTEKEMCRQNEAGETCPLRRVCPSAR
jgi:endonuclease III